MSVAVDSRELRRLAADLGRVPFRLVPEVEAVVRRGAHNVKEGWRENARRTAGRHAKLYPNSITYDSELGRFGTISYVVGPDKTKPQGALGNLLEFGSSRNPPHHDGQRALDVEAPKYEAALGALAGRVLDL